MEASQNVHIPNFMKEDKLSEECKNLITSLPLDKDFEGNNVCNYKGCWYYFNALQAILDFHDNFRPQATDVIIASYPKSGTTWLKALTFALIRRGQYRENPQLHPLLSDNPHNLVPFLELDLYCKNKTPDLDTFPSPRLFGTHIPFHTLHETLKDSPCKIVYVCRNIKDTLVSYWHFKSKCHYKELTSSALEAIFDSFCKGVHCYGPFWDHTLSYWTEGSKHPKHVLFMRYEEMMEEPRVQIKRLAEFLDCPFTDEEEKSGLADEILELCSLRKLSNLEVNKTGKASCDMDNNTFFRKGEVGDWKNHLTPVMEKTLDEIIEKKLHGSGLKFG